MSRSIDARRGVRVESGGAFTTARGVDAPILDSDRPFESAAAAADRIVARHPDAEAVARAGFRIIRHFPIS